MDYVKEIALVRAFMERNGARLKVDGGLTSPVRVGFERFVADACRERAKRAEAEVALLEVRVKVVDVEEKAADYEVASTDLLERVLVAVGIDAHDPFGDEEPSELVSLCSEIERFLRPPTPEERALELIMRFSDPCLRLPEAKSQRRRWLSEHRTWVMDQVVRALAGDGYESWVARFNAQAASLAPAGGDGFCWSEGSLLHGAGGSDDKG